MPRVRLEPISFLTLCPLSVYAHHLPPVPGCVSGCLPTRELAFGQTRTGVPARHQSLVAALTLLTLLFHFDLNSLCPQLFLLPS